MRPSGSRIGSANFNQNIKTAPLTIPTSNSWLLSLKVIENEESLAARSLSAAKRHRRAPDIYGGDLCSWPHLAARLFGSINEIFGEGETGICLGTWRSGWLGGHEYRYLILLPPDLYPEQFSIPPLFQLHFLFFFNLSIYALQKAATIMLFYIPISLLFLFSSSAAFPRFFTQFLDHRLNPAPRILPDLPSCPHAPYHACCLQYTDRWHEGSQCSFAPERTGPWTYF